MKRSLVMVAVFSVVATATVVPAYQTFDVGRLQYLADGNPMPPFPPKQQLVADGNPMPPFPPKQQLVADGNPMPPFPPAHLNATMLG